MKWWQAQQFTHLMRAGTRGNAAEAGSTYLTKNDFLKMMGVALAVHVLFFTVLALFPDDKVTNIPVRALSFRLGDQEKIAAYDSESIDSPKIAAPVMSASSNSEKFSPAMRAAPKLVKVAKVEPVKPKPHPPEPVKQMAQPVAPQPFAQMPTAAGMQTPQQYVREVGQAAPQQFAPLQTQAGGLPQGTMGGVGNVNTQTDGKDIRDRYEQQISGWIERHKVYPAEAGGREGRVIVRMRIDRAGVVRYYALEQSCGVAAIDNAALDMIRRANPVPAAPMNYPGGSLIEFLIPITFNAP